MSAIVQVAHFLALAHQADMRPQIIELRPEGRWHPQAAGSVLMAAPPKAQG
jgi:hypothetical protein